MKINSKSQYRLTQMKIESTRIDLKSNWPIRPYMKCIEKVHIIVPARLTQMLKVIFKERSL